MKLNVPLLAVLLIISSFVAYLDHHDAIATVLLLSGFAAWFVEHSAEEGERVRRQLQDADMNTALRKVRGGAAAFPSTSEIEKVASESGTTQAMREEVPDTVENRPICNDQGVFLNNCNFVGVEVFTAHDEQGNLFNYRFRKDGTKVRILYSFKDACFYDRAGYLFDNEDASAIEAKPPSDVLPKYSKLASTSQEDWDEMVRIVNKKSD